MAGRACARPRKVAATLWPSYGNHAAYLRRWYGNLREISHRDITEHPVMFITERLVIEPAYTGCPVIH